MTDTKNIRLGFGESLVETTDAYDGNHYLVFVFKNINGYEQERITGEFDGTTWKFVKDNVVTAWKAGKYLYHIEDLNQTEGHVTRVQEGTLTVRA